MSKERPSIHEALAADGVLRPQVDKMRTDLAKTFADRRNHFLERLVTYTPVGENEKTTTEEQSSMQTTVRQELTWLFAKWSESINLGVDIAAANAQATAPIELGDNPVTPPLPATALLDLEKRVTELRALLQVIPTLDPTKGFTHDTSHGTDIFVSRDEVKTRTKKLQRPLQLAAATDHHPAQVQLVTEDVVIGTVTTREWSGMLTPAEKSAMIERADTLLAAVKRARASANRTLIPQPRVAVGALLFGYILNGFGNSQDQD